MSRLEDVRQVLEEHHEWSGMCAKCRIPLSPPSLTIAVHQVHVLVDRKLVLNTREP